MNYNEIRKLTALAIYKGWAAFREPKHRITQAERRKALVEQGLTTKGTPRKSHRVGAAKIEPQRIAALAGSGRTLKELSEIVAAEVHIHVNSARRLIRKAEGIAVQRYGDLVKPIQL